MSGIFNDFRFAARRLRRDPGFTIAATVILALGIGGATQVFSRINALYLRPLAVEAPEQLVRLIYEDNLGRTTDGFALRDFEGLLQSVGSVLPLAATAHGEFVVSGSGGTFATTGKYVSQRFFPLLGVRPHIGRFLTLGDDAEGVVLSYAVWTTRFGQDPSVVGRVIRINGHTASVVGVAPEGFSGIVRGGGDDIWAPMELRSLLDPLFPATETQSEVFGRLRAGASRQSAQQLIDVRTTPADPWLAKAVTRKTRLRPLTGLPSSSRLSEDSRNMIAFGAALLILVIAAVNVAGLLLTRAVRRRKDVAVQLALGIQRRRLIQGLLAENILLYSLGAVGGTLLAVAWQRLSATRTENLFLFRSTLDTGVDGRVLAFALGLALVTSLIFGLAPALAATRVDLVSALKDTGEPAGRTSRVKSFLVVAQMAVSVPLLILASQVVAGLQEAAAAELGFNADGVIVAMPALEAAGYSAGSRRAFLREWSERVQRNPGVREVSLAAVVPMSGKTTEIPIFAEGGRDRPSPPITATVNRVSADYFRTLEVPVVRGRAFQETDRETSPPVAVVSEALASELWRSEPAVGKQVRVGNKVAEVVGIARDIVADRFSVDARPLLYLAYEQEEVSDVALLVKTTEHSRGSVIVALAAEANTLDPNLPRPIVVALSRLVSQTLAGPRSTAVQLSVLGLIGFLLSMIGLYGTTAYQVALRTREIGVRMALGAQPGDVLRMVVRDGLRLVAVAAGLGVIGAVAVARVVTHRWYDAPPVRWADVVAVVVALAGTALVALWIPARRASAVNPNEALRKQ